MSFFNCNLDEINKYKIVDIDISDNKSWNLNTGLTINSLKKYNDAITSTFELPTYGLTAFDYGLVNSLTATTTINYTDNKLKLQRVGENDFTGNTSYTGYSITPVTTATTVGNYFLLEGGYFTGFYKLHDYEYEILPYRYNEGLTISTWINVQSGITFENILSEKDGFFFYMGTLAENKYSLAYSGDTIYSSFTGTNITNNVDLSGNTTGITNIFLNDHTDLESGITKNVIAFRINQNKQIGYRFLDYTGNTIENYSDKEISYGWNNITITFKPKELIKDKDLLNCYKDRDMVLTIYLNGIIIYEEIDFKEIWFKQMFTEREKQLHIPYVINWGGGSFGLKHSWHFNNSLNEFIQDERKKDLLIESNFDGSFYGGIQKLELYNKALNFIEVRKVIEYYSKYNINNFKGGRLINI
jgi:hypothetical protein